MTPLLKMEHVTICYNGEIVVQDINLELNKGEILGVVGESGSGKSTIIKAVMGLLGNEGMVTEGDIWYKGKNIVDMQEKELRTLLGPEIARSFRIQGQPFVPSAPWAIRFMRVCGSMKGSVVKSVRSAPSG